MIDEMNINAAFNCDDLRAENTRLTAERDTLRTAVVVIMRMVIDGDSKKAILDKLEYVLERLEKN